MTAINPQFIATEARTPTAIYGIGDSPEAALLDAEAGGATVDSLATYPATVRLAEVVLADGGSPSDLGRWTTRNAVGLADLVRDEDQE